MTASELPYVTLVGAGVELRPYRTDHARLLAPALGHPQVFAGGWGGGPAAARSGEAFVSWLPTYLAVDRAHVYTVFDSHGAAIGTTTIADIASTTESAHIGYTAYAPEVWGTTVNAACKLLLLGHLFDHGFGRVKLQADVRNERSRLAIVRLGAQFEGITRRDQQCADGSWRDAAVYSILIDEWPAVRNDLRARISYV